MMLSQSGHIAVQSAAPTVSAGRKLNPQEAVFQAQAALSHRDTVGQVQHEHGGFGLRSLHGPKQQQFAGGN